MCGMNLVTRESGKSIMDMQDLIKHRGPDRSGVAISEYFEIGHQRLSINGLGDKYTQPLVCGKSLFMFTGEFYNFREYDEFAENDTVVLFDLIRTRGPRILSEIDWMGAIIYIPDIDLNWAFVYTDFLSKKPIYYNTKTLSVSSEITPLIGKDTPLDHLHLANCVKWGYDPHPGTTPYENIRRMGPGERLSINEKGYKVDRYDIVRSRSRDIGEVMQEAVVARARADVPISLLLSGGFDSSLIFKLMEKHTHNFSIFHVENGESDYLNYLDIPGDIKVGYLTPEDPEIDQLVLANEGIQDLGSLIPQYQLAEAMSGQTSVVLTGDGADELFGGYRRSMVYDSQSSDIWRELVHYHLPRLDKINMRFSIEQRSPFLSRKILETALFWGHEKRKNKNGLKEAFRGIVPDEIIDRPKVALKSSDILSDSVLWRSSLLKEFMEEKG